MNIPKSIGAVMSAGHAKLFELETIYSVEDVYLMLEINSIDSYNRIVASKSKKD